MAKHTFKILRCEPQDFKLCLAILQHYAWKGSEKKDYHNKYDNTRTNAKQ